MAKKKRLYQPYWELLKKHLKIKVEVTTSARPEVQVQSIATLRKALQKEKYLDVAFRAIYVEAKLVTEVVDGGKALLITLDRGLSSNDKAMNNLF